ncbi:MAG: sulfite exporter TauE/SafE family protein [Legionella sp.]|jgi:uncharacterized membrane protein YfcA
MTFYLIIISILVLSLTCTAVMVFKLSKQASEPLSPSLYFKLILSGIIAFISDTVGIGSFAVNTALAKLLGTFTDDELPAMNNGAQVIPGTIESLFFMQLVNVDLTTLVTLVAGTCVGGLLGGFVVCHLSKQAVRLAMVCCFALIITLLLCHQFHILPIGGELIALHSWKLVVGFLAMVVCGTLTSVGVGLFVMVQGVLFLLNVSPLVAFPIMTTAGAMQQPLTTLVFLRENKIPLKKTMVLSLAGCLGVFIILPLFTQLTVTWLHTLLLGILFYNFITIGRAYLRDRGTSNYAPVLVPSES